MFAGEQAEGGVDGPLNGKSLHSILPQIRGEEEARSDIIYHLNTIFFLRVYGKPLFYIIIIWLGKYVFSHSLDLPLLPPLTPILHLSHLHLFPHALGWVNEHVHSFLALGPPFLGAPKALRAVLTGDCMGLEVRFLEESVMLRLIPNAYLYCLLYSCSPTTSIFSICRSALHFLFYFF